MNNKTLLLVALGLGAAYFIFMRDGDGDDNGSGQKSISGDTYPPGTIFVSGSNLPGRELVALEVLNQGHSVVRIPLSDLRVIVGDDQGQLAAKDVVLTVKLGDGAYKSYTMPQTTNEEMINQAVPGAIALSESAA